jgi:hypothetical protein
VASLICVAAAQGNKLELTAVKGRVHGLCGMGRQSHSWLLLLIVEACTLLCAAQG